MFNQNSAVAAFFLFWLGIFIGWGTDPSDREGRARRYVSEIEDAAEEICGKVKTKAIFERVNDYFDARDEALNDAAQGID